MSRLLAIATVGRWLLRGVIAISVLLLGTVVLAVVIAAKVWFASMTKDIGGDNIEARAPVPAVQLPPSRQVYVALGDSYSAGEGLAPYLAGTEDAEDGGDRCHRSDGAYSQLIEFTTDVERRFRACSGAVVEDMWTTQSTSGGGNALGPQVTATAVDPGVGLITLTIGGNDLGFASILPHCYRHFDCAHDEFDDSFDDGEKSGLSLEEWAQRRLDRLATELAELYGGLRERSPDARIVVIEYPNLLWSSWGDMQSSDCAIEAFALSNQEANDLLRLQAEFNDVIEEAARRSEVEYLRTAEAFRGHEPCGAVTPRWLDYIVLGNRSFFELNPGTLHPNRNGHYILARMVSCYLAEHPEPSLAYDEAAVNDCALAR